MKRLLTMLPALLCLAATTFAQSQFTSQQSNYWLMNNPDISVPLGIGTPLGIPGSVTLYYDNTSEDLYITGVFDPSAITAGDPPLGNYMWYSNPAAANEPLHYIRTGTSDNQIVASHIGTTNFEMSRIDQTPNYLKLSAAEATVGAGFAEFTPTSLHLEVGNLSLSQGFMANLDFAEGFLITGPSASNTYQVFGVEDVASNSLFTVRENGQVAVNGAPNTTYTLTVNGSGTISSAWFVSSDRRYKTNIKPIESPLEKILKLNGMTYNYNQEQFPDLNFDDRLHIGFIAQELEKVVPEVVMTDEKGFKAVNYANITALLAEALKEEHQQLEEVKKDMEQLLNDRDAQIQNLQQQLDEIKALLGGNNPSSIKQVDINGTGGASYIEQNSPNPFGDNTAIKYFVNVPDAKAQIMITDMSGRNIKTVDVEPGHGTLELNFSDFPAGNLIYSLYVNGQVIGSKQMVRK